MRINRDRLIFKALCALDEAADECGPGPIRRTFALRFALAYLWTVSEGERGHFDAFWRIVADPQSSALSDTTACYIRASYARTALTGIARGVGYPETPEAWAALRAARMGGEG